MLIEKVKQKSFYSGSVNSIGPKEAYNLCLEGMIIIDIRNNSLTEFKKFDVPNSIFISKDEIKSRYKELNKENIYLVADSSGLFSKEITLFLNLKGYNNVFNLSGGIIDWERAGLPVKTNTQHMLSGSCSCQLKYRNYNDKS